MSLENLLESPLWLSKEAPNTASYREGALCSMMPASVIVTGLQVHEKMLGTLGRCLGPQCNLCCGPNECEGPGSDDCRV